jgi:hypothetical protein
VNAEDDVKQNSAAIWQAIDACRPGSDDERCPELAPLADRLAADAELAQAFAGAQRFDMLVAETLDDVPLPAGFEQRLLAALVAAQTLPTARAPMDEAAAVAAAPSSEPNVAPVPHSVAPATVAFARARSPRRWLVGVAAVAAAVVAGAWLSWPRAELTAETLPIAAQQWFLEFDSTAAAWHNQSVPAGYTFPVRDLGSRRPRWAAVNTADGYQLAAYDLSLPTVTAYLFVLDGGPEGLPTQPPTSPQRSTGAQSVAVWQAGGLTYALVVQGDAAAYRRFLLPPPETA